VKKVLVVILAAVGILGVAALLQRGGTSAGSNSSTAKSTGLLTVYCAAGLKKPVEAIAEQYRKEFNVEVRLQYGPSGALLSNIRVAKLGDLLIAADDGTVADARKSDSVREVLPLVRQHPVIGVRAGNPKNIQGLADLLREDVKVALPNPDAASIGRVTRSVLGEGWTKLAAKAAVMKPSVTEIAADLSLGAVDAAIIWDATVPQFKDVAAVEVKELAARTENASATVLTACAQPAAALKFARYLAAPDRGGVEFQKQGFKLAGGDVWAEKPSLVLYSGGVNRLSIEKQLQRFADRENIDLTTVFNGCGILCATMKTMGDASSPKFPDVYFACDVCFVPPVAEHFREAVMLTETEIGIVVKKGNPRGVHTLADLAQAGLRVGLCNAEQSTLGYMTRGMLKSTGLQDSVRKNVVVETPTADMLINQMRAGGLDAAVVYSVNAKPQAEHLEFKTIQHAGAKAVQPFAVRSDSKHKRLAERLLAFLRSNRSEFEQAGFQWRGDEASVKSKDIEVPEWLREK
jgi:molybdate transport system substrate-binding protein